MGGLMYICTDICMHMSMYAMCIHLYACTYIFMKYIHKYVCMFILSYMVHMYVFMLACMCKTCSLRHDEEYLLHVAILFGILDPAISSTFTGSYLTQNVFRWYKHQMRRTVELFKVLVSSHCMT
ncbi:hypothetical protein KP509_26G072700 [Ceratopteris richardii]|uniref:Uncharacterized protein n=1 Tax=Ceratopteris richardii TaxID=49495 RepID=A0A8T2RPZ8_CERRI|nr:hypothetical protein KP509_26G072700 [Ceratopteris richardii]